MCPAEGGRLTRALIKERQAELSTWQLVVTHSVAYAAWEKIVHDAMPSLGFRQLQCNVFQHWGNCGENSLPVTIIQAVHQASCTCSCLTQQQHMLDTAAVSGRLRGAFLLISGVNPGVCCARGCMPAVHAPAASATALLSKGYSFVQPESSTESSHLSLT